MTIDPGLAVIGAAAIAALAAGVGAVIAYLLEGHRVAAAERRQDARDRAKRLRRLEVQSTPRSSWLQPIIVSLICRPDSCS